MFATVSFQNIGKLSASAFAELDSTPFFIHFESTENDEAGGQYSRGEVCLHLADAVLAKALVEAINRTVAEHNTNFASAAQQELAVEAA